MHNTLPLAITLVQKVWPVCMSLGLQAAVLEELFDELWAELAVISVLAMAAFAVDRHYTAPCLLTCSGELDSAELGHLIGGMFAT